MNYFQHVLYVGSVQKSYAHSVPRGFIDLIKWKSYHFAGKHVLLCWGSFINDVISKSEICDHCPLSFLGPTPFVPALKCWLINHVTFLCEKNYHFVNLLIFDNSYCLLSLRYITPIAQNLNKWNGLNWF